VVVWDEASFEWQVVLRFWVDSCEGIVGGDYYAFRADEDLASLDCGLEGVVICPDLEVVSANLFWA